MKIFFLLIAGVFFISCAGTPTTHFYLLESSSLVKDQPPAKFPFSLGVERILTEDPYADDRLIYRDSLYEIKFYHYHRWATSPSKMVTGMLLTKLKQSALFKNVYQLPAGELPDFIVTGRLKNFEEWDEAQQWFGRVQIEFVLGQTKNNRILLQKEFFAQVQVEKREPVAVVKALGLSVEKCLDDFIKEIGSLIPVEAKNQ